MEQEHKFKYNYGVLQRVGYIEDLAQLENTTEHSSKKKKCIVYLNTIVSK